MASNKESAEREEGATDPGPLTGSCRCGAVRLTISVPQLPAIYCCHCLLCQSSSGSAFSEQAIVPEEALAAAGPILDHSFRRPDGGRGHHRLCSQCYTRLWSTNDLFPRFAFIRAGTLDRSQELIPAAHMWAKRKQPWIEIAADVPQWSENPPPHELIKALNLK